MEEQILFCGWSGPYGFLSNFSFNPFYVGGRKYYTSEAYYQCQKFPDNPEHQEKIRITRSSAEARKLGKTRLIPKREDWYDVKEDAMREALRYKFSFDLRLMSKLRATRGKELVENSPWDDYWGSGRDGKGKNVLGKLLMELRDSLL